MFIAKKQFSSNQGTFRRGQEVPAEIAARYPRNVEETAPAKAAKPAKPAKVEEVKVEEEILTEDSAEVSVETEEE